MFRDLPPGARSIPRVVSELTISTVRGQQGVAKPQPTLHRATTGRSNPATLDLDLRVAGVGPPCEAKEDHP